MLERNPSPTPFSQMFLRLGSNFDSDPDAAFGGGEVTWASVIGGGVARAPTRESAPTVEAGAPSAGGAPASPAEGGDSTPGQSLSVGFSEGASRAMAEAIVSKTKSGSSIDEC